LDGVPANHEKLPGVKNRDAAPPVDRGVERDAALD
jgi:hypothetical protein